MPVPVPFSSSISNEQYKAVYRQAPSSPFSSKLNYISQKDRKKNVQQERWMDRFSSHSSIFDASTSSFCSRPGFQYCESSNNYSGIINLNKLLKSKGKHEETNVNTTEFGRRDIISQASCFNNDTYSSGLFDPHSNHVGTKAKTFRSSYDVKRGSTNTFSSWQKYWLTKNEYSRRIETNKSKPEQSTASETHFTILRDSPYLSNEHHTNNIRATPVSRNDHSRPDSFVPSKFRRKIHPIQDNHLNKDKKYVSSIELSTSPLIPSSTEMISSSIVSKTPAIISSNIMDKGDEKHFTEKSFLLSSSSNFKSDSQILDEIIDAQGHQQSKQTVSPPPPRTNPGKNFPTKRRTLSKSKHPISTNHDSSLSKYSLTKWNEPYVRLRLIPPAPPCSRLPSAHRRDSEQEDLETSFEQSQLFEHNLPAHLLESCIF